MHVARHSSTLSKAAPTLAAGGVIITAAGFIFDGGLNASNLRFIGVALMIIGTVYLGIRSMCQPEADMYEAGRQMGYDQGWNDQRADHAAEAATAVK